MKPWKSEIDPVSKTEEIFFDNGDTLPARFNVDSKDIKEGKKIGEGIWTVHEAEWRGRKVAVKKFVSESTFGNVSLTSREVNRMLGLRHPNVLKLWGFCLTAQRDLVLDCTMIMELMDCDLEAYIGRGALSDDQVVYIIAEVARGMNHVHKKGFFHRDLKPQNVLLRKSDVTGFRVDVKIADFGSSELMAAGDIDRTAGALGYKAPEQFDSASTLLQDKVDVFGFGALCFKILTGKAPYESPRNVREVIEQLDRAAISQRNLPEDVVQIIWDCLDVNPESRPDFEMISRILDGYLSALQDKMVRPLPPSTTAALHSKESLSKKSRILDGALSAIRDKMARLLLLSTCTSLHSKESMSKGGQGYDHLESILHNMGLSKEYGVHLIPFKELIVIGALISGSAGYLYKVKWKGVLYAQKVFHGTDVLASDCPALSGYGGVTYFQTFPKLVHKNIVTFMGYCVTPDNSISIIMELQAMDLSSALHDEPLTFKTKVAILREIAEGMKYLHDQDVAHGDLKPSNVVVSALDTDEVVVKLIDIANDIEIYTTRYCAPERLRNTSSSMKKYIDLKKSDVYSFAILCQEILGGDPLFGDYTPRNYRQATLMGRRPSLPIGTSPEMVSLIQSCWNEDPQERPNFSEVCERLSQIVH